MNWHRPKPEHVGRIADAVAGGIELVEREQGAVLPDLRSTSKLGLACDFSGQHSGSKYDVYSFVLFDLERHTDFEGPRTFVREFLLKGDRRLAYKNLRDNVSWRALEPFLTAAGQLSGVLLTVAVPKIFSPKEVIGAGFRAADFEDLSRFDNWPVGSILKAVWVVHLASILVAGLAAPGQDLIWIVDQDEIVEGVERQRVLSESFCDVISDYLDFTMGRFDLLTAASDEDRRLEDLLSIADLAAGAWSDTFNTVSSAAAVGDLQRVLATKSDRAYQKAKLVVEWCSQNTHRRLKYVSAAVYPGDSKYPIRSTFVFPKRSV